MDVLRSYPKGNLSFTGTTVISYPAYKATPIGEVDTDNQFQEISRPLKKHQTENVFQLVDDQFLYVVTTGPKAPIIDHSLNRTLKKLFPQKKGSTEPPKFWQFPECTDTNKAEIIIKHTANEILRAKDCIATVLKGVPLMFPDSSKLTITVMDSIANGTLTGLFEPWRFENRGPEYDALRKQIGLDE